MNEVPAELPLALEIQTSSKETDEFEESDRLFWEILLFGLDKFEIDIAHEQYLLGELRRGWKGIRILKVGRQLVEQLVKYLNY